MNGIQSILCKLLVRSNALRRATTLAVLTSCAILGCWANAWGQQDFSSVEIKVHKVAGNVYMLEGSGGNIGVSVGDDGIVIVDDEFAPLAPKIKAALKGITDKPLRFVLNTHFHGDHTGGNPEFGKDATIIAHENVRKRLQEGGTVGGNSVTPAAKEALPVITFNDRATVHLNGEDIRAIHFPNGHTDGDSVIFFPKSNVVHMGDDFVTYGFPFVDVQNGGSVSGMIAGVEKVLTMVPPDVKFIPGHGPVSSTEDVRKFVEMLKDTRALVAKAAASGKTLEQMKDDHVLSKYESLGKGFIKTDAWIELLVADIQKNPAGAPGYQAHGHASER
ncbi:MAG TPA: MBL fold metallo-hydrolase [Verrucomicrobiae bacterium]|nr:MBL fold metallo-hydrolase [Verrucomicrobiae bacterium]